MLLEVSRTGKPHFRKSLKPVSNLAIYGLKIKSIITKLPNYDSVDALVVSSGPHDCGFTNLLDGAFLSIQEHVFLDLMLHFPQKLLH